MTGSSPAWPAQAPRAYSLWCIRCQERATAVPYRVVAVAVVTSGPVCVLAASFNSGPWRTGQPIWPGWRSTRFEPQPPQHLHGQIRQRPREPCRLVPVEDHQDGRVALAPVPGGNDPADDLADLAGGHRGQVISRAEPDRVQQPHPRRAARLQRPMNEYGQPGIICALLFPRP